MEKINMNGEFKVSQTKTVKSICMTTEKLSEFLSIHTLSVALHYHWLTFITDA